MTKSPESPPQDDDFQPQQVIPSVSSDSKYVQKSISALTFSTNSQEDITYSDNNGSGHNDIDNDIDTYGTAHDRIEDLEGAQLPSYKNKKLSWGINNGDNSTNLPNTPDRNSTQKARGSVVTFATAKQSIHQRPVYRASLESDQSPEEQFLYIKKNTNDSNRSGHSSDTGSVDSKGMPRRWGFKRNISSRRNSRPSIDSVDSHGVPIAWSRMSTVGGATVGGTTRGGAGGIQFHQIPTMSIAPGASFQNQSVAYSLGQSNKKRPSEGPMQVEYLEAITLPQSTHTLLFTEYVFSLPFGFAFLILILSIGCLALALTDNLDGGTSDNPLKVPPNVSTSVRIAQYFSVVVAVLMEEEIPTALYLLRMIPRSSLEAQLGLSYTKFCASAMCRLVIGYMFLFNVLLVVVQSEGVLDMFYDMLALNFVAMIDDISFRLSQLDILGKRLRNATTTPSFRMEFERKPYAFRKKMTNFTKFIFCANFLILFACVIAVGTWQKSGYYQCPSLTVALGDEIWRTAYIRSTGENKTLIYSYFNGVYSKNGTHASRPVYRELRKSEEDYFETIVGAEIRYCEEEEAWVFMHEDIMKTQNSTNSPCPWLLRSPKTDAYDLLEVPTNWEIWTGVINQDATLSTTCNECQSSSDDQTYDTDCNFNGICTPRDDQYSRCICNDGFFGVHCQLEEPCTRIISEPNTQNLTGNLIWVIMFDENCKPLKEYGRPVYALENAVTEDGSIINNLEDKQLPFDVFNNDKVALIYSGSRWLGTVKPGAANLTTEEIRLLREDYHAFWNEAYKFDTVTVSDPTMGSSPVGVDFFLIGERGPSYGPLGVLYPLQQPPGKGLFRCPDENGMKAVMTRDSTTTATKQVVTNNMKQCANVTGGRFMGNQEVSLNVAQALNPP